MKQPRREFLTTLTAAATSAFLPSTLATAEQAPAPSAATPTIAPVKETVLGFGGFFFRANDPKALGQWYQDHLGIPITPQQMSDPVWTQQAGTTLFTPFPETTKYFGDPAKQFMLNFRVRDLDKITAQLEAAGIPVKRMPGGDATYGYFAHLHDPEGNPIELWQAPTEK
jgi:glyoxylase I family protein